MEILGMEQQEQDKDWKDATGDEQHVQNSVEIRPMTHITHDS